MRFTNWDRFKDDKSICEKLGCSKEDRYICCPDLDGNLCKHKKRLLISLNIKEEDLDNNLIDANLGKGSGDNDITLFLE